MPRCCQCQAGVASVKLERPCDTIPLEFAGGFSLLLCLWVRGFILTSGKSQMDDSGALTGSPSTGGGGRQGTLLLEVGSSGSRVPGGMGPRLEHSGDLPALLLLRAKGQGLPREILTVHAPSSAPHVGVMCQTALYRGSGCGCVLDLEL